MLNMFGFQGHFFLSLFFSLSAYNFSYPGIVKPRKCPTVKGIMRVISCMGFLGGHKKIQRCKLFLKSM